MPNIIPQVSVPKERDLSPVSESKSRSSIYGNYKRPIGMNLDATLEFGYMPQVFLPKQKYGAKAEKTDLNKIKQKF